MKNYGKTECDVRPESVTVDECSVWVANNVTEVEKEIEGETRISYEYNLTQYDKDEYIKFKLDEQSDAILELADLIGGML